MQSKSSTTSWAVLGRLSPAGWRGNLTSLLILSLVRQISSSGTSCGLTSSKNTWTYWSESAKGLQRQLRNWNISQMRKSWESWDSSFIPEKRSLGGVLAVCVHTWGEGVNKRESGISQWYPVGREHKLKHWKHFFLQGWLHTCIGCPQKLWTLYLWRYVKPDWAWLWTK